MNPIPAGTGILQKSQKIKGTVVLSPSGVAGSVVDAVGAMFTGRCIALKLISATKADENKNGKVGKEAYLEQRLPTLPNLRDSQGAFGVYFEYDADFGIPGAFYIKSSLQVEFFLISVTLEDIPNHGTIHFDCNSWVYSVKHYQKERIFFANDPYLPSKTPEALVHYRKEELENLRGDGTGERKEWDRIYDYDVYNDLGNPDKNKDLARHTLGGSSTYPYPRRVRTGRAKTNDGKSETPTSNGPYYYVPRDEMFSPLKLSSLLKNGINSLKILKVLPNFQSALGWLTSEFDSFEDVRGLFEGGISLPTDVISEIISSSPGLKQIFRTDGEQSIEFPPPHVIKVSKSAWMTDEEFAREMLAGVNPCLIRRLQEFPPKSKLESEIYGDQKSEKTEEKLKNILDGLTVKKALDDGRLFILDHHDAFMPYLRDINKTSSKAYATRTILFLKDDDTLKPVAIELSRPHDHDQCGTDSEVILPADEGVESTIWLLAKAYVVVNDSCYHQLMSHWLNTHAVIEPFIIATHRHLSVLHPIHKLLLTHYRDTMQINALARQSLINAGGIIEQSFLPGQYSMEMSSAAYEHWVFLDQALPTDLVRRGMATEDRSSPHGLRLVMKDPVIKDPVIKDLVIKDYPYAVDGLEIWDAIKTWVKEYVSLYYATDDAVRKDSELQAWWKEVVEKGHGDLKNEPWWPELQTTKELIQSCTIIIWIASAFHAAVNFGQYPYGGYILNRPTLSRRLLPKERTEEYDEMRKNPQKAYLSTITPKFQALLDLSVIEILSMHASDEVYLGQRDNPYWTSDPRAIKAFKKFGGNLAKIEAKIAERNKDPSLSNRFGPAELPYTLLVPSSDEGMTFRGIPNSVSI